MADSGKFNPYLRADTNILQRIAETVQDVPADSCLRVMDAFFRYVFTV